MKIAFSGHMGSGKTTASDYLGELYACEQFSFADQLRVALVDAGLDPHRLYRSKDATARVLMQAYGRAMREQNPRHWVDGTLLEIKIVESMGQSEGNYVIDDLRYWNEATILREHEWVLVRIEVIGEEPTSDDDSETDLDDWPDWDYVIRLERGDIEGLFSAIDDIIDERE